MSCAVGWGRVELCSLALVDQLEVTPTSCLLRLPAAQHLARLENLVEEFKRGKVKHSFYFLRSHFHSLLLPLVGFPIFGQLTS